MERRKYDRRQGEDAPLEGERRPDAKTLFEEHGERRGGFDRRSGPKIAP